MDEHLPLSCFDFMLDLPSCKKYCSIHGNVSWSYFTCRSSYL